MAYFLAVAAAMANALTTILQRMGVQDAPKEASLHLSLLAHAFRRKVWLAGFGVMVAAFLFQASALHFGTLTVVQPILTLELPFLVLLLGTWLRNRLGWREWFGSISAAGGLAAFLLVASPKPGHQVPDIRTWGLVAFAVVLGTGVSIGLAQYGPPAWRAAMFGVSAAITFAFTAALIKQVSNDASHLWYSLFLHWHFYAMAVAGLVGLFLAQNAFHAGPVTASQATLVVVDPLVSIAIGIGLFNDHVDTSSLRIAFEVVSMLVLCVGGFVLARSPIVELAKTEDAPIRVERRAIQHGPAAQGC